MNLKRLILKIECVIIQMRDADIHSGDILLDEKSCKTYESI